MSHWTSPLLFGHRGAPAEGLAENTLASFARARARGVTALETDVHMTQDGHVVAAHDEDLQRVFGVSLVLKRHILAHIQNAAPVPTLLELLSHHPDIAINIDIKQSDPPMEDAVIAAVRSARAEPRVLLTSFSDGVVNRVRAAGYAGPTGLSRNEIARLALLPKALLQSWRLRGARAQVPRQSGRIRFDTPTFIAKAHALGIAVDFWTINDKEQARELLALGADGIMTDDPRSVAPAFDIVGPRDR